MLHRAGFAALGIEGESEALRTPLAELGPRLEELARRGWHGVNLTHPLKEEALRFVTSTGARAGRARSVNTIRFGGDGMFGDSTDGVGFVDWIETLGRRTEQERVVMLGAGGAARSIAEALLAGGGAVAVWARDPAARVPGWEALEGAVLKAWDQAEAREALGNATLVVNATPAETPLDPGGIPKTALVVDLVYGPELSPWAAAARAAGLTAYDGLGMLVHQARRAFGVWCDRMPPVEALERAVGWPR